MLSYKLYTTYFFVVRKSHASDSINALVIGQASENDIGFHGIEQPALGIIGELVSFRGF